jgi:hypothetical protein
MLTATRLAAAAMLVLSCTADVAPTSIPRAPPEAPWLGVGTRVLFGFVYEHTVDDTAVAPVAGASIEITDLDPDIGATIATVRSDTHGRFVVDGLPGTIWLIITSAGHQPNGWHTIALRQDTTLLSFELVR